MVVGGLVVVLVVLEVMLGLVVLVMVVVLMVVYVGVEKENNNKLRDGLGIRPAIVAIELMVSTTPNFKHTPHQTSPILLVESSLPVGVGGSQRLLRPQGRDLRTRAEPDLQGQPHPHPHLRLPKPPLRRRWSQGLAQIILEPLHAGAVVVVAVFVIFVVNVFFCFFWYFYCFSFVF